MAPLTPISTRWSLICFLESFDLVVMSFVFEDIFYSILIKNFSYRGCLHRGEVVLEQPRGCRVSVGSTEAEGVPLQEGHRNMQLQLHQ